MESEEGHMGTHLDRPSPPLENPESLSSVPAKTVAIRGVGVGFKTYHVMKDVHVREDVRSRATIHNATKP